MQCEGTLTTPLTTRRSRQEGGTGPCTSFALPGAAGFGVVGRADDVCAFCYTREGNNSSQQHIRHRLRTLPRSFKICARCSHGSGVWKRLFSCPPKMHLHTDCLTQARNSARHSKLCPPLTPLTLAASLCSDCACAACPASCALISACSSFSILPNSALSAFCCTWACFERWSISAVSFSVECMSCRAFAGQQAFTGPREASWSWFSSAGMQSITCLSQLIFLL